MPFTQPPPSRRPPSRSSTFHVAWPALLLAAGLALPFIGNPFFLDDWHVLHRADLAEWSAVGLAGGFTFLDPTSIETWNFPGGEAAHYFRPLVVASYKLDLALWGFEPVPSHAVNLLLHLASILLLAALVMRLTGDGPTSRLAALLFAIQPQNTVAVLWTSGRTELLVAVWILAGVLLHVKARQEGRPVLHLAVVAMGLLASLSKESSVVLPACVAAYELTRLRGGEGPLIGRLGRAVLQTLPSALVAAAYLAYRFGAFDAGAPLFPPYFYPPGHPELPARALAKTAYNLIALPTTLFVMPLFVVSWLIDNGLVLAGLACVTAGLYGLALHGLWRHPLALLGALWLAAALLPTLPILTVELYLYFPSVGFALLGAVFFRQRVIPWAQRRSGALRRAGVILLASYLGLYAVGFVGRGFLYREEGQVNARVFEDVRADGGEPGPGTNLLLVNMPVAASHLAPMARLHTGHRDVRGVLLSVSPEWTTPRERPRVECLGPRRVRIFPSGDRAAFFETEEEQSLHLLGVPIEPDRPYPIDGLTVTPLSRDGRVVALDVVLERSLAEGLDRIYTFHDDGERLAHRACSGPP